MIDEANKNVSFACPAGCNVCDEGREGKRTSVVEGEILRGWRLAMTACVAFIFPVALAVAAVVAASFMPTIRHNETARMVLALTGVVTGIVIAALIARRIRPSARNADEF